MLTQLEKPSEQKPARSSKSAIVVAGLLIPLAMFAAFIMGALHGRSNIWLSEFKRNEHNLLVLTGSEFKPSKEKAFNELIKAQTYDAARYVPDSWLNQSVDQGVVDFTALGELNITQGQRHEEMSHAYELLKQRIIIQEVQALP